MVLVAEVRSMVVPPGNVACTSTLKVSSPLVLTLVCLQGQQVNVAGTVPAGPKGNPTLGHPVPGQLRFQRGRHARPEIAGKRADDDRRHAGDPGVVGHGDWQNGGAGAVQTPALVLWLLDRTMLAFTLPVPATTLTGPTPTISAWPRAPTIQLVGRCYRPRRLIRSRMCSLSQIAAGSSPWHSSDEAGRMTP